MLHHLQIPCFPEASITNLSAGDKTSPVYACLPLSFAYPLPYGLVQEEGLADVLNLGDCALEIKCFGENNLEDLW